MPNKRSDKVEPRAEKYIRKNYLSASTSQLIMQVSDLMSKEKPIPKRNKDAIALADMAPELLEVVKMWNTFWDTMPKGQMGKLTFDVGLFNDALMATSKVLRDAASREDA